MSIAEKKKLYLKAKDAYYLKDKPIMSDAEFNELEDWLKAAVPTWPELNRTGVSVAGKKAEVRLREFMPSLNKRYPEKVDSWVKKHLTKKIQLLMAKLDGTSLQLEYNNGVPVFLATRGDGTTGQDVSFLIPYLNIPKRVKPQHRFVVRCEALLSDKVFNAKWKGADKKNKDQWADARGMVNGLFNRQLKAGEKAHPAFKDISIVVLGMYGQPMLQGLLLARRLKFETVVHKIARLDDPTAEALQLSKMLEVMRKQSVYAMDGIVLCDAAHVLGFVKADKPTWMIAYKENDLTGAIEVVVEKIIYQISGNRRITPKIYIHPVKVGTVMVKNATCHNAAWMSERKIGPGAHILILRSGDVIPKIVGVVKPGKVVLPDVPHKLIGRFFVADDSSKESEVEVLVKFFVTVGIEFIKDKTLSILYEKGLKTPHDYMKLWHANKSSSLKLTMALHTLGLGKAKSVQICGELNRVFGKRILLEKLMIGSGKFPGVGDRRLDKIDAYWLTKGRTNAVASFVKFDAATAARFISRVPTFKQATIDMIMQGHAPFRVWLRQSLKYIRVGKRLISPVTVKREVKGPLTGEVFTFTLYRDKTHEAYVESLGATVAAFSAKTTIVVHAEGKTSAKVTKAKDKGLKVFTYAALLQYIKKGK